jgi:hypothetical protein
VDRLDGDDGAEPGQAGHVVPVQVLHVLDARPQASRTPERGGRLERVDDGAVGGVADRVGHRREPGAGREGVAVAQHLGAIDGHPHPALGVGIEHPGRPAAEGTVGEELGAAHHEAVAAVTPGQAERGRVLEVGVGDRRPDAEGVGGAAVVPAGTAGDRPPIGGRLGRHVVDGGDPERGEVASGGVEGTGERRAVGQREDVPDQPEGELEQQAGGLAVGVAHDGARRRVGGAGVHAGERQGRRVRPSAVVVLGAQQDGVTRRHAVEVAAVQARDAPTLQREAGAEDPGSLGQAPRGGLDARQPLLHRRGVLQPDLIEFQAVLREVEVGVVEAREDGGVRGLEHPGGAGAEGEDLVATADGHDAAGGPGDGLGGGVGRVHRVDAVGEQDRVGGHRRALRAACAGWGMGRGYQPPDGPGVGGAPQRSAPATRAITASKSSGMRGSSSAALLRRTAPQRAQRWTMTQPFFPLCSAPIGSRRPPQSLERSPGDVVDVQRVQAARAVVAARAVGQRRHLGAADGAGEARVAADRHEASAHGTSPRSERTRASTLRTYASGSALRRRPAAFM